MSFNVGSGVFVQVYVLGGICGYREENNKNPKKPKKRKNYNMFWILEKSFNGIPTNHGKEEKQIENWGRIEIKKEIKGKHMTS